MERDPLSEYIPTGKDSTFFALNCQQTMTFLNEITLFYNFPYYPSYFGNFRIHQIVENVKLVQSLNTQHEKQNLYWDSTTHTILCPCFPNIPSPSFSVWLNILCKDHLKDYILFRQLHHKLFPVSCLGAFAIIKCGNGHLCPSPSVDIWLFSQERFRKLEHWAKPLIFKALDPSGPVPSALY